LTSKPRGRAGKALRYRQKAQGELAASQNLADATKKLTETPDALHHRILTTLNDLGSDQSNTVIFAILLKNFTGL
jgi:hypothetical protein